MDSRIQTKWTPGPWSIVRGFPDKVTTWADRNKGIGGSIHEDDDREHFAVVIADARRNEYSKFAHEISEDTARANARLIAAAPDLVEPWQAADDKDWDHLFRMLPDSGHGQFWKKVLTEHRAALRKAGME